MLKCREPVSAFAMYSTKRKSVESSTNSKKLKRKHSTPERKVSRNDTKVKTRKKPRETSVKQNLVGTNGVLANKTQNVKKKSSTVMSSKTSSNKKSGLIQKLVHKKENKRKVEEAEKSKSSVKNTLVTVNSGVAKMKRVKHKQQKQSKKMKLVKKIDLDSVDHIQHKMTIEKNHENPLETSRATLEWLIQPVKVEDFFEKNWEKTPIHIKRNFPKYYKMLMSTPMIDKILRENSVVYSKNIDITSYANDVRETHNPVGRAHPNVVWDYYRNGCSVRLLNPQAYMPKLYSLNATLQEFFGCFVGANSYLTPPNSQGFAPHYDDIEAFILQIEGKKRWRLYKPRHKHEYLSRFSSRNFLQSEIGEPILDTVVNAGDLLYFPRGTIHQGETIDDTHSLHITLSVYQKNSWGDFIEKLLPDALSNAVESDCEFRKGLPPDYLRYCGWLYDDVETDVKEAFKMKIKHLCTKLIEYIDVDMAADLMAKNHIQEFLPPVLSETEKKCSVLEDGLRMIANGAVENRVQIELDTRIRLLRYHCIRVIAEEEVFRIYYSTENSKEYREYEPQFLEVGVEFIPAIQEIITRYPEFMRVEDLPIDGEDNKIQIAKDLWEKCLIVTDIPLCPLD
ncbi:ribosomal oxygenase 1 [Ceratina calcarata]|uniref:Bifunctional lysine-specific demethylase and histidyl-hydroxylase n=1 Tax=Ceratina calcarata TaxID=156304 RepID=A0AAJ7N647_9HYME|nr:ribosomal oxygenase 1 [Ceratina calcarata]